MRPPYPEAHFLSQSIKQFHIPSVVFMCNREKDWQKMWDRKRTHTTLSPTADKWGRRKGWWWYMVLLFVECGCQKKQVFSRDSWRSELDTSSSLSFSQYFFRHFPLPHTKNTSFAIRGKKVLLCFSRDFCRVITNEFYLFLSQLCSVGRLCRFVFLRWTSRDDGDGFAWLIGESGEMKRKEKLPVKCKCICICINPSAGLPELYTTINTTLLHPPLSLGNETFKVGKSLNIIYVREW